MLEFFLEILGFGIKLVMLVVLLIFPLVVLMVVVHKIKKGKSGKGAKFAHENLEFVDLKREERERKRLMQKQLDRTDPNLRLEKKELAGGLLPEKEKEKAAADKKKKSKQGRKEHLQKQRQERLDFVKELEKKRQAGEFCPRNLFVIDFRGSTKGTEFKQLRGKIDAILSVACSRDEVVVNLCSPGGLVNTYGLCAAQLQRLRAKGIFLTVTVDEVAASGGYLMACVANKIVAAPFSYIGSIGVIAGMPNFRRALNKFNVDYEQVTAGKYKRTLSMMGENTEEGRQKFKEELEAVHERFKELVKLYRPQLDLEKVATGEHWLASDAQELGLVDKISTSNDYIHERLQVTENSALKINWKKQDKQKSLRKLLPFFSQLLSAKNSNEQECNDSPQAAAVSATTAAAAALGGASWTALSAADDEQTALQVAQEQLQSIEQSSFLNMR